MEYVGIDLHKKESQICLLTEAGEVMECRIRTEPQRFAETLGTRPRARILLEASTESEWVLPSEIGRRSIVPVLRHRCHKHPKPAALRRPRTGSIVQRWRPPM
jgi:hypothetical protein